MNDATFQKLLDDTTAAAQKHDALLRQCKNEIRRRYGIDYGESDCDEIIDSLDYGSGGRLTIAAVKQACELARQTGAARNYDEQY